MTRPDFQGGNGRLGFWNLYGRLMNEGPFAGLELKLDLLQAAPGTNETWASIVARVEGGSVANADQGNGSFLNFRLAQLYARVGNVLLDRVIWQLGTLHYFYGDLGLYDMRPATLFDDTVGLSARYEGDRFDLILGVGDSGFATRGFQYAPLFTGGIGGRLRLFGHLELGAGAQVAYEPFVEGNRFSSYVTPGLDYEQWIRGEVVQRYAQANPGRLNDFPRPQPAGQASLSWRAIGYLGFGKFGPIKWSSLFARYQKLHPKNFTTETFQGTEYTLYVADLTRDRYQLTVGNEMQLTIIPDRLDAVWSVLYGNDTNFANTIQASEDNRIYYSTVLRLQAYLTKVVHVLAEGSAAHEESKNGRLWREHYDSIFANTGGVPNVRGLEFGDTAQRNTVQVKGGFVLNPTGLGVYARPSIRLLYGLQYSTQQAAYGNGFVDSLDQFNAFPSSERRLHHLISLEAEGWF